MNIICDDGSDSDYYDANVVAESCLILMLLCFDVAIL